MSAVQPVPKELRGRARVAAIVDPYGGVRVVIGPSSSIRANTRHDELCLTIPGWRVSEPVPWGGIPFVVRQCFNYVDWWIGSRNDPDFDGFKEHVAHYRLRLLRHPDSQRTDHLPDMVET